jgi:GTP cyclohydrolase I
MDRILIKDLLVRCIIGVSEEERREKQNSMMTTSSVLGSFHNSPATRNEFLSLISRPRP